MKHTPTSSAIPPKVLVGLEELEPDAGWLHSSILGDLTTRPAMIAAELSAVIVRCYVKSY